MRKLLLVGGYPKGHEFPFDTSTVSGKRIRKMLAKAGLEAEFLDLWSTEEEEKKGHISITIRETLREYFVHGYKIVALGKHVEKALEDAGFTFSMLPHPASRRKIDLERLEAGLLALRHELEQDHAARLLAGGEGP